MTYTYEGKENAITAQLTENTVLRKGCVVLCKVKGRYNLFNRRKRYSYNYRRRY